MTPSIPIIGERCHYCSRYYSPRDLIEMGESIKQCFKCREKHDQALNALAGTPPQCCAECGITWDQLRAITKGDHVRMAIHMKDGMYQALCSRCDEIYVQKRKDLYGPTRFGHERGLS